MSHLTSGLDSPRTGRRSAGPAWVAVLAACVGQFVVILDVSVINVALPSIRSGLGIGEASLQWVVNAYVITFAGFLLLGGRFSDLFGRKKVFLLGLGVFTAASLLGGLAQSPWMLIVARALQGIGAAVLSPATLTILTTTFPEGSGRVRAVAAWTAVGTGGGAAGGLIGGLLTDYLSWRWVLLINVPLGLVVIVASAVWLAENRSGDAAARRLDLPGAVLATLGVGSLAFGISQSETHGWSSARSFVPLLAGVIALLAFIAVERRAREPLTPLGIFRVRTVSVANVITVISGMAFYAMWYFLSLYMQNVLGYSAVETGLALLPHTASIILSAQFAPRIMRLVEGRVLLALAGLLTAAGFFWQSVMGADGTFLGTLLGPGIAFSFGAGLMMTLLAVFATSGVGPSESGLVAGLANTSRTMGGALGLSVLASVAASRTAGAGGGPEALAEGYGRAFLVSGVIIVVSMLAIVFLPKSRQTSQEVS
ncbi:DHA2 family efflux MFS transporter permease subunit [Streptomyces sp. NRRL B-1677]|uniref:DHA2 family efflux MFS transporter permease subunit n=1 Tax=Streptomyces klenkii TaxID=1420899 RepID=A0A3B0B231_9ACTN|nr:MFS transporter [Streptomyces klenkii]MBF6047147.1 DHA2 family efflux MFS transporter permease subunit [Streptomyces sp. NRRL B-1677]RKN65816.1 DHA2 family efflux MFS transporter permease subunit [Streptomyces klenkii]